MTRRITYVSVELMFDEANERTTSSFKIGQALQKAIDRYPSICSAIFTLEGDQYLVKDGELSELNADIERNC